MILGLLLLTLTSCFCSELLSLTQRCFTVILKHLQISLLSKADCLCPFFSNVWGIFQVNMIYNSRQFASREGTIAQVQKVTRAESPRSLPRAIVRCDFAPRETLPTLAYLGLDPDSLDMQFRPSAATVSGHVIYPFRQIIPFSYKPLHTTPLSIKPWR